MRRRGEIPRTRKRIKFWLGGAGMDVGWMERRDSKKAQFLIRKETQSNNNSTQIGR